jgi:predicted ferric reductase
LWYVNRATGIVLLVLFTAAIVLGVLAMGGRPGRGVPRFVAQSLHRNIALFSILLLGAHVASAVIDTYVDIPWWQAVVPFGGTYKPIWLALGAVALDLALVVVATSLVRTRLQPGAWRGLHVLAWAAWVAAVAHSVGIGTDYAKGPRLAAWLTAGCCAAMLGALATRLSIAGRRRRRLTERAAA